LDLILKTEIKQVVDWNLVDKEAYLSAMQRSVIKDVEIKALLKQALTHQIDDRAIVFCFNKIFSGLFILGYLPQSLPLHLSPV
jgi:fido (protein-threonine AMPylation protein)